MTYTYPPEEYMKLLQDYNELEAMRFSPADGRETVIAKLSERTDRKREISEIANTMVREYVETFEKEPDALTAGDAEALQTFMDLLMPDGERKNSVTDFGIMLRIARILDGYYRRQEDWDRYAIALNRCCLGYHVLFSFHAHTYQESPYAEDAVALARRLGGGGFSERARIRALLSLIYTSATGAYQFDADHLRIVKDLLLSNITQPPTELEETVLLFFFLFLLEYFRDHCFYARAHGIPVDTAAAAPLLKEACAWFQELLAQGRTLGYNPDEIRFFLLTTDFFLGNIPIEALLDGLNELQRAAEERTDPAEQVFGLAEVNYAYLTILYRFSPLPKEEIVRLSRERVREVMPKLMAVSRRVNNIAFNRSIFLFLNAASLTGSFDEFGEVILETTVYADKALYVHTAMVREISLAIFDYMIKRTPEAFDGVAGRDAAYIRSHRDEMRQLLSDCCMYHDIGKFFILDVVENSMRRLTDDEFRLIRQHPGNFESFYQIIEDKDERVLCIRDCAMTHHQWHDGSRGYPNVPLTKNRPFADILAVADSIDAATDFIGRPYKSGKSIEDLIAEFQAGAGTQYGPDVVAALSAPELQVDLQYYTVERRREINYRIYAFNRA